MEKKIIIKLLMKAIKYSMEYNIRDRSDALRACAKTNTRE